MLQHWRLFVLFQARLVAVRFFGFHMRPKGSVPQIIPASSLLLIPAVVRTGVIT